MLEPSPEPAVARLTSPAQLVASLPYWLGYVPTESLVVGCCHEPGGRVGLTLRVDLPAPIDEQDMVKDLVRRIVHQQPTRLVVAVWTDQPDSRRLAREELVDELCQQLRAELPGLTVTEAVLVRNGRFWSYLCDDPQCCPPEGVPLDAAVDDPTVRLLQAEQVLRGQVVQPDRAALERTLAGPELLAAAAVRQRCVAAEDYHDTPGTAGRAAWRERWAQRWQEAADRMASPPFDLGDEEAALLATSLRDVHLRDALAGEHEPRHLMPLLAELMRRTPAPHDAPVCGLFAWVAYCDGGGAEVTIALERALRTDPTYSLAVLLHGVLHQQVPPAVLREVTVASRYRRGARRRGRR